MKKLACDYGFLPENDGKANAIALQAALDGGGEIYVSEPGVYSLSDSVMLDGDTELYFCKGSYIKREPQPGGNGYAFVNRGAYTKKYDSNIRIEGLSLVCNGVVSRTESGKTLLGLRGQLSFFYVKNLIIRDFECLDLPASDFCIHICTFSDAYLENLRIEGRKDAVHFGSGRNFTVRNGYFKTYDDPIALNAHDYISSNPELGWIENGLIENCYDLNDDATVGYFCRILSGSWLDWYPGIEVQRSDTVLSSGKLYRVSMPADGRIYRSVTRPEHESGTKEYDGIRWYCIGEGNIRNVGCRNIRFKDIHLQKNRPTAFSLHFDKDEYSRSYYPNSVAPIQENISFENVRVESESLRNFIHSRTPIRNLRLIGCKLGAGKLIFKSIDTDGIEYPELDIYFSDVECEGTLSELLENDGDIKIKVYE